MCACLELLKEHMYIIHLSAGGTLLLLFYIWVCYFCAIFEISSNTLSHFLNE